MSALAIVQTDAPSLPAMVHRAARALASATTAAEVLDARDAASLAYDAAKRAARLHAAKGAHDTLIAAAHRSQADALEIEAQAKRRLADEYDAAQERGEAASRGRPAAVALEKRSEDPTFFKPGDGLLAAEKLAEDLGLRPAQLVEMKLTKAQVHEARQIRDAEEADPGIVRRVLDEKLERGEEPTKAALRQAVTSAAISGLRGNPSPAPSRRNPIHEPNPQYDIALAVAGGCRSIVERAGHLAADYILDGFLSDAMREREVAAIRACRDFLSAILEVADA